MKTVLCVGSVTTDIIVTPADTIPTPGTLRSVDSVSAHVGGCAANAAMDLGKIGVPVILSCKVGEDIFGGFVCDTAKAAGVDIRGVVRDPSVATTVSIACVSSSGERSFMYNPASTSAFVREDVPDSLLEAADIVFVAGAMLLTKFDGKPCADLMKRAREMGKMTVMDTAWDFEDVWLPKVVDVLPHLDLFMPSVEEAAKLTGEEDPQRIADRLFEMGARNVVVKVGKQGALVCPAGGERMLLPTYRAIKPVDTTGAGDAFCAGFLTGLAQDWDYKRCGEFANAVGTHCIMAIGASDGIKSMAEIQHFMDTHEV
jgi:pfkB domain protein